MSQDLDCYAERAGGGVASYEGNIMSPCESRQSGCEFFQPMLVDFRQCQRKQCPSRSRTHCSEVAQVDGEHAMANGCWWRAVWEMHALNQRVHCRYELR